MFLQDVIAEKANEEGGREQAHNGLGSTSDVLITANPNSHRNVIIQNLHGSRRVFLSLASANAVANKGIVVPAGGSVTLSFCGAIKAIASGADTGVRLQEL